MLPLPLEFEPTTNEMARESNVTIKNVGAQPVHARTISFAPLPASSLPCQNSVTRHIKSKHNQSLLASVTCHLRLVLLPRLLPPFKGVFSLRL